jgi:hypothetical protein
VAVGITLYGAKDLAAHICDATVMNAIQWGDVNERYCCDTGRPLGVSDFGLSAGALAMVYDGLTCRYGAKIRRPRRRDLLAVDGEVNIAVPATLRGGS